VTTLCCRELLLKKVSMIHVRTADRRPTPHARLSVPRCGMFRGPIYSCYAVMVFISMTYVCVACLFAVCATATLSRPSMQLFPSTRVTMTWNFQIQLQSRSSTSLSDVTSDGATTQFGGVARRPKHSRLGQQTQNDVHSASRTDHE
jgi:hypothetical protein